MPGKGFLKANSNLQIQIKVNKFIEISAKLLISYCVLVDPVDTVDSFDKIWNGLSKDKVVNEIIPIKRTIEPEKITMYKKTDSPIYSASVEAENWSQISL